MKINNNKYKNSKIKQNLLNLGEKSLILKLKN